MNKQVFGIFMLLFFRFFSVACSHKADSSKPKATPPTMVDVLIATTKPMSNTPGSKWYRSCQ